MAWPSWLRKEKKIQSELHSEHERKDDSFLGISQKLIDQVKCFTVDTFKNFQLEEVDDRRDAISNNSTSKLMLSHSNVKCDLSDWQQQHAVAILSEVKELSQIRFQLCPRLMKEHIFWRIYFTLVNDLVAGFEVQAAEKKKHTQNDTREEGGVEIEMAETPLINKSETY